MVTNPSLISFDQRPARANRANNLATSKGCILHAFRLTGALFLGMNCPEHIRALFFGIATFPAPSREAQIESHHL